MFSDLELLSLVASVFVLGGLIAAVHALFNARSPQGTVAWVVSLVTFPYVALPLYLVFGRGRFRGYGLARRQGETRTGQIAGELSERCRGYRSRLEDQGGALAVVETLARMPFTRRNRVTLLPEVDRSFEAIFARIEAAERYVLVQYFILRDDGLGGRLKDLLCRKARAGVRVYLLYDEIGSHALGRSWFAPLREAGAQVRAFHTTRGRANRLQINFRNHRKIVVVDGRHAFIGGANVGDEYLGLVARIGGWRDTHVELEGPAVQCVQLSFLEDWYWATQTVPELEWEPRPAADGDQHVLVLPTGPADDFEGYGLFVTHAIHSARRRLWIASPYFVPDSQVVGALQLAALRGVDVRILLPEKPDHLLVYLSSFSYFEACDKAGVRIYRYQPGFLHQKVMLIDEAAASVGTANLDNRSFKLNFEITTLVVDRGFAREVERMLEADFARSRPVGLADLTRRGLLFQLAVRFARLLAPIQ